MWKYFQVLIEKLFSNQISYKLELRSLSVSVIIILVVWIYQDVLQYKNWL